MNTQNNPLQAMLYYQQTELTTRHHDNLLTVGRYGSKTARIRNGMTFPVWSIKRYRRHITADGRSVAWLADPCFGQMTMSDRYPSDKITKIAKEIAKKKGYMYADVCIHKQPWPTGGK